jgi:hypothetical protein
MICDPDRGRIAGGQVVYIPTHEIRPVAYA